jgi:hypothetical protein
MKSIILLEVLEKTKVAAVESPVTEAVSFDQTRLSLLTE